MGETPPTKADGRLSAKAHTRAEASFVAQAKSSRTRNAIPM
ncbi:MAG: hypothetical protein ACLRSW_01775 [Christensenellaceae bacterium]